MTVRLLKFTLATSLSLALTAFVEKTFSAVDQSLNDLFYQNPAELTLINQVQWVAGDLFVEPKLTFTGSAPGGVGSATSKVNNNLPYLLGSYRLSKRFVLGINITPTGYGHTEWPIDSIVSTVSTKTNVLYYRSGIQFGYQLTDKLSVGAGLNLEIIHLEEVDFLIPNLGNQVNKASGYNYTLDIGLFYKINPRHSITAAAYTPVNMVGSGTSTLNTTVSRSYHLGVTEASVVYIGLQHVLSDRWSMVEKIYWSGWSIQKNLHFENTTTGSFIVPTNWIDVWSYQMATRYATTERIALLGSVIYETNPNPTVTNSIGYPLAASTFISVGLDINLVKKLSTQLLYGYGMFTPKAKINNPVTAVLNLYSQ